MISVLVVGPAPEELEDLEGADPSVEVLLARGAEDALEKLGRNRRIDAILLVHDASSEPDRIVAAIREDSPAHPPIFVAAGPGVAQIAHTTPLAGDLPSDLINLLKERLEP